MGPTPLAAAAALTLLGCLALGPGAVRPAAQKPALPDVLTRAFAYYATLTSYADTGTVEREAPGILDKSKFTTYVRRPTRDLYFDYQTLTSTNPATRFTIDMSVHRTVIWMFKGEMETYGFYSKSHEVINAENGGQVRALQGAGHATSGTSMLVPSLLYTQARLPSTFLQIEEATVAGTEEIGGRRCHKVTGVAAAYYPSGQRTGVRPVTVWIDAETQLIRRVFEDTAKGTPAGSFNRTTITYEPQANPTLDDAKFRFTVPGQ